MSTRKMAVYGKRRGTRIVSVSDDRWHDPRPVIQANDGDEEAEMETKRTIRAEGEEEDGGTDEEGEHRDGAVKAERNRPVVRKKPARTVSTGAPTEQTRRSARSKHVSSGRNDRRLPSPTSSSTSTAATDKRPLRAENDENAVPIDGPIPSSSVYAIPDSLLSLVRAHASHSSPAAFGANQHRPRPGTPIGPSRQGRIPVYVRSGRLRQEGLGLSKGAGLGDGPGTRTIRRSFEHIASSRAKPAVRMRMATTSPTQNRQVRPGAIFGNGEDEDGDGDGDEDDIYFSFPPFEDGATAPMVASGTKGFAKGNGKDKIKGTWKTAGEVVRTPLGPKSLNSLEFGLGLPSKPSDGVPIPPRRNPNFPAPEFHHNHDNSPPRLSPSAAGTGAASLRPPARRAAAVRASLAVHRAILASSSPSPKPSSSSEVAYDDSEEDTSSEFEPEERLVENKSAPSVEADEGQQSRVAARPSVADVSPPHSPAPSTRRTAAVRASPPVHPDSPSHLPAHPTRRAAAVRASLAVHRAIIAASSPSPKPSSSPKGVDDDSEDETSSEDESSSEFAPEEGYVEKRSVTRTKKDGGPLRVSPPYTIGTSPPRSPVGYPLGEEVDSQPPSKGRDRGNSSVAPSLAKQAADNDDDEGKKGPRFSQQVGSQSTSSRPPSVTPLDELLAFCEQSVPMDFEALLAELVGPSTGSDLSLSSSESGRAKRKTTTKRSSKSSSASLPLPAPASVSSQAAAPSLSASSSTLLKKIGEASFSEVFCLTRSGHSHTPSPSSHSQQGKASEGGEETKLVLKIIPIASSSLVSGLSSSDSPRALHADGDDDGNSSASRQPAARRPRRNQRRNARPLKDDDDDEGQAADHGHGHEQLQSDGSSSSDVDSGAKASDRTPDESLASDVLRELRVTKLMGDVEGFVGLTKAYVVQGSYPSALLEAWDVYDRKKNGGSENCRPDVLPSSQTYAILVLPHGGTDLESFKLTTWSAAASVFFQVLFSLSEGEREAKFEHRDLHWGNVLVKSFEGRVRDVGVKRRGYGADGKGRRGKSTTFLEDVRTKSGVRSTVIDFTLSRASTGQTTEGTEAEDGGVIAYAFEDKEIFEGEGDQQFDVYRTMRAHTGERWMEFKPLTNLMWLHYLSVKLLREKKLRRPAPLYSPSCIPSLFPLLSSSTSSSCLLVPSSASRFHPLSANGPGSPASNAQTRAFRPRRSSTAVGGTREIVVSSPARRHGTRRMSRIGAATATAGLALGDIQHVSLLDVEWEREEAKAFAALVVVEETLRARVEGVEEAVGNKRSGLGANKKGREGVASKAKGRRRQSTLGDDGSPPVSGMRLDCARDLMAWAEVVFV